MDEIDNILSLLLMDIDNFEDEYKQNIKNTLKGSDIFPFNFLQFRQKPLIPIGEDCLVCPSVEFLMDKATEGIYWILENHLKNKEKQNDWKLLPSIYGDAFEEYVNDRLSNSFKENYIKNPLKENGNEISDGLIYGKKNLFIIETKYAHWSNLAMLTGKKEYMTSTLKQILSSPKKKKGLGQITRSIEEIEKGETKLLRPIKNRKIIPVIVVGEGMPMDWLNRDFYEAFAKKSGSFYQSSNVLPFIVLDAEEVEILEGIALDKGLDEAEKLLVDYSRLFLRKNDYGFVPESMQFKNYLNSIGYPTINNANLFSMFDKIHKTALKKGFRKEK